MRGEPPDSLLDQRSDPDARMVLEDFTLCAGWRTTRLGCAVSFIAADAAGADAADAAAAAADDAADAADAAADDAADAADAAAADDAADDADAAAADDAADDADAAAGIRSRLSQNLYGDLDMRNGLKIIRIPGGRYGYPLTMVGWLRRVNGDEYDLIDARVMKRTGAPRIDGLQIAAEKGPGENYSLGAPGKTGEEPHRLLLLRAIRCNEKAWAKHCPKPKDWKADEP